MVFTRGYAHDPTCMYVGNRCGNRVSSVRDFTVRPLLRFFCPRVAYIRSKPLYTRLMNEFSIFPFSPPYLFLFSSFFLSLCRSLRRLSTIDDPSWYLQVNKILLINVRLVVNISEKEIHVGKGERILSLITCDCLNFVTEKSINIYMTTIIKLTFNINSLIVLELKI